MLAREPSARTVIDSQSEIDQGDTMSCSESSSKQSRKHHVACKSLLIPMSIYSKTPHTYMPFTFSYIWPLTFHFMIFPK